MLWLSVDVPMERVPFTNWLLLAATLVATLFGWSQKLPDATGHVPDPALVQKLNDPKLTPQQRRQIVDQLDRDAEAWQARHADDDDRLPGALDPHRFSSRQLVTYLFVHNDVLQLLGNMLFLFCFGNAVNAKLGHLTFLALYFACGAFAGLAWLLLGGAPVAGANGAVMGVTGAFLVLYPLNEIAYYDELSLRWFGDAWRFASYWFILASMLLDLVGTLGRFGGVAYLCHFAGELLGVGVTAGLVLTGVVRSGRGETNLLEAMGFVPERPRKRRKLRRPPADG